MQLHDLLWHTVAISPVAEMAEFAGRNTVDRQGTLKWMFSVLMMLN